MHNLEMFSLQTLEHHFYTSRLVTDFQHPIFLSIIFHQENPWCNHYKMKILLYLEPQSLFKQTRHLIQHSNKVWHILTFFVGETMLNVTFTCSFVYLTFVNSCPLQRYTTLKITPSLLQMMTKNKDKRCISSDYKGRHILKQINIQRVETWIL